MKRIAFLLLIFLGLEVLVGFAQIPNEFNYQAVIRDASEELVKNQNVSIKISILDESETILYSETHTVASNAYGMINVKVGSGVPVFSTFAEIVWTGSSKFIKVEADIDGGTAYTDIGTSELSSVPFAIHANSASLLGSDKVYSTDTDTLFVVKDQSGNVVFAVFPDGAQIFVDETVKGKVGGFAVSGRNPNKAESLDIFKVTPDSTRVFVNETAKGKVGGFAVSGRNPNKGLTGDYLQVTKDSTRVYVTEGLVKGKVGGFAVSGRNPNKGIEKDYFNISGNLIAEIIDPSEARIFWYPKKEAFLTGRILVESPDSVGTNSMSTGFESKSIGNYSQALGYKARAKGNISTAIGNYANAQGDASYAFGNYAMAQDSGSYAIGSGATASGLRSFAIGSTGVDSAGVTTSPTKATGDYSYSFGMGSVATNRGAIAIGTQDTTAGDYSVTLGYQCKSGNWAGTAIGYKNSVTANGGTALGYESIAGAVYSTAIGYKATTSTGWWAVAIGERTSATGFSAVSIGRSNTASGNISSAIGYSNTASGPGATALGANNQSTADYSMALGYNTNATGNYSISLGRDCNSSSLNTITIGNGSIATFNDAIAIGYQDTASGNIALATGRWTKASGIASFSAGDETKASGQGAFSIGYRTNASGFASIASGSQSTASGSYSFATGFKTVASTFGTATFGFQSSGTGRYSFAAGYETVSQAYSSMVIGRWNVITGSTTAWSLTDPVFVIGNGTSTSTRTNALTVLKNGRIGLQSVITPTYALELPNSATNGIGRARANLWTTYSDGRVKSNRIIIPYGLDEIMKLTPQKYFQHNSTTKNEKLIIKESGSTSIGLVAQDVFGVIPEAVLKPENEEKELWGISYEKIVPVLIKGVQEQQTQIDELKIENKELKNRLEKIEKLLMAK
jgi:hypothetical protein